MYTSLATSTPYGSPRGSSPSPSWSSPAIGRPNKNMFFVLLLMLTGLFMWVKYEDAFGPSVKSIKTHIPVFNVDVKTLESPIAARLNRMINDQQRNMLPPTVTEGRPDQQSVPPSPQPPPPPPSTSSSSATNKVSVTATATTPEEEPSTPAAPPATAVKNEDAGADGPDSSASETIDPSTPASTTQSTSTIQQVAASTSTSS